MFPLRWVLAHFTASEWTRVRLAQLRDSRVVAVIGALWIPILVEKDRTQVGQIAPAFRLDVPYASGVLEDRQLIRRKLSDTDRRQRIVELTAAGRRLLAKIEKRSNERALRLTARLSDAAVTDLLGAMGTIRHLLTIEEQT